MSVPGEQPAKPPAPGLEPDRPLQRGTGEGLRKELTLLGVFAVATGTTLSAGLFLLPGLAAQQAGPAIVLCYALAIIPLIPAAISKSELATAMPRAGGVYYFLDRSLGPLAGSVGGLGTWLALTLKTAFALIGMGAYVGLFFPDAPPWLMNCLAAAFAILFGFVNWLGTRKTGLFQMLLVAGLLALLAWFVARGAGEIQSVRFEGFLDAGFDAIIATTGLVYISYVGVTKVVSVSEEVRNPERNLPLGVFLSIGTAVVVYALCTAVMVGVLPMEQLAGSYTPMADAARAITGKWGVYLMSAAAIIAFSSVANAGILSASRYPLAMARDDLLPTAFGRLNKRRVPTVSIVVTVALIVVLVLTLDPIKIAKLASAFQLLMLALLCAAVIVMRESHIESYDPGYRSPLYPWMQIFGIIVPIFFIQAMGWLTILFSSLLVGIGITWYLYYARPRVVRYGAIYHVFERLGRQRFDELDIELRSILKEKGLRRKDPFEETIAQAAVLDLDESPDFEEIARRASERLVDRLPTSLDVLVEGFLQGTRTGMTPVTHGVALPHMRLPGMNAPEMAIVRCRAGIDIEVVDVHGESTIVPRAYAVFFLISPEEDPGQHLRLLANLARIVDDEDFLTRWQAANEPHELRRLLMPREGYLTITLTPGTRTEGLIDRSIRELELPDGCLVAVIRRPTETIVPSGSTVLYAGDRLMIIGNADAIRTVAKRYED